MKKDIYIEAYNHVQSLYQAIDNDVLSYHNYDHTLSVLEEGTKLAEDLELSAHDTEILRIAILFHDVGYPQGQDGHEQVGADMAASFLATYDYPQADIDAVKSTILATTLGTTPTNQLERIISDADMSHLGMKGFEQRWQSLLREMNHQLDQPMSIEEWCQRTLDFMQNHHFHTEAARKRYDKRKNKNAIKIKTKINSTEVNTITDSLKKPAKLGRGVETMYRVTLRNHNSLSRIADNKASIMISINAIMISIIFSSLLPKLDNNPNLLYPTLITLGVCVLSIVYAILSARPKFNKFDFDKDAFLNKKFNVLFFGNFHSMELDEFEWALDYMKTDEDLLYSSLTKDLYFLGIVLVKKYRLLRICYNIFMYGLIVSAITFFIALLMGNPMVNSPSF